MKLKTATTQSESVVHYDTLLAAMSAQERVRWALQHLHGRPALTSSFGAQAAVGLHLLSQVRPNIPVILIDTGYLFAETYRFIDQLVARLSLNLHVFRPELSPAWLEARHGQLWQEGRQGIRRYNELAKMAPMARALADLDVGIWFAGLRRGQAASREDIHFLHNTTQRWKVHPIADWTDRDVYTYLRRHDLPYHPLWSKGYLSIGDTHTTRPFQAGMPPEEMRFFGLQRECGIHELR